jgi:alpha-L-rhamnosidase
MGSNNPDPFGGRSAWIWPADDTWCFRSGEQNPYPVAYFRRTFRAPKDATLTVHVSADSRYILWCNGKRIGRGPAKGDVRHHFYETYELDDLLVPGQNVLAAQVMSYAPTLTSPEKSGSPNSVMTWGWMFLLEGSLKTSQGRGLLALDSGSDWKAIADSAYMHRHREGWGTYLGMFEDVDGSRYPWGWQLEKFDDSGWKAADEVFRAVSDEELTGLDGHVPNTLTPRIIPMLPEDDRRFDGADSSVGIDVDAWRSLIIDDVPLTIPAGTSASVTLWTQVLETGFPELCVKGGTGSTVRLTYNEALEIDGTKSPDHAPDRGDVIGYYDQYTCGGGTETYEPFHWRTFRYVRIEVTTGDEPLTILSLRYRFTAYPFDEIASFSSSDPDLERIRELSWRTARLCAHETYEDCPYYEQLQYVGDTQVQALISFMVTGDARLAKQAIRQFDWSRDFEGLVKSRYPSRMPQYIPSYSLLWVQMVHDYWMHTGDVDEVRQRLDGIQANLRWFEHYLNDDGVLEALPYWKVVDWVAEWNPSGYPPGADGGVSALINFQFVRSLLQASEMAAACDRAELSHAWKTQAVTTRRAIVDMCWSKEEGLFHDRPDGSELSELTNAWAILAGVNSKRRIRKVASHLGRDERLARATLYGRFYVLRALSAAGAYEDAEILLDHWRNMMKTDLTTWPEEPYLSRSYCHAWSAAPMYDLLSEILGVKPAEPGFATVQVRPHVWNLDHAEGSVPTPLGDVMVSWSVADGVFTINVSVPPGMRLETILPDGTLKERDSALERMEHVMRANLPDWDGDA